MRPPKVFLHRVRSQTHSRLAALLSALFVLLARPLISAEDITSLADPKTILNAMPLDGPALAFKIPPRPAGHILDNAHFLTQEMLLRLEGVLSQEARDNGVDIYLLTVPSVEKNTLEPFTEQVMKTWMNGLFGATIVFDDGTGRVSIGQSDVVTNRFYEYELSVLLRESMNSAKRPRLSRDGLEHTTMSVKAALHELKLRANHQDRNSLLMRAGLALIGLVGLLVGALEYFRRRPTAETTSEKTVSNIASPEV